MDVIAEQKLFASFPDGETASVYLCVGRPVLNTNGHWVCPVRAEGLQLWEGPTEFSGVGSWDALMLGLRFLHEILSTEAERGAVFYWEGGEHRISIEQLFARDKIV